MKTAERYETRQIPDDLWNRMKELRRERAKLSYKAQAEGGICATGFAWTYLSILAGFGSFGNPSPGANYTRLARKGTASGGLTYFVEVAEEKGLTPVCGAIDAHLGQVYAGLSDEIPAEDRIKPDFIFHPGGCHATTKAAQLTADLYGVPLVLIDEPYYATERTRKYLFSRLMGAIDKIGQITGKTFDDEKFIDATRNSIRSMVFWSRTCELMKNVPAPMTYRQAMSLRLPLVTYAYSPQAADYMESLYEVMKERVRDGIAGSPYETKRLIHFGIHPLYRPDVLKWPEEYGAVFVQGGMLNAFGAWRHTEDGHMIAPQTVEERGVVLKSREDAVQALVDIYLPIEGEIGDFSDQRKALYQMRIIEDWKCDGVMIHHARRCAPLTNGLGVIKDELRKAGIPFGTYEASESDPKEFDEHRIREEFAIFLEEILGLKKMASKPA